MSATLEEGSNDYIATTTYNSARPGPEREELELRKIQSLCLHGIGDKPVRLLNTRDRLGESLLGTKATVADTHMLAEVLGKL